MRWSACYAWCRLLCVCGWDARESSTDFPANSHLVRGWGGVRVGGDDDDADGAGEVNQERMRPANQSRVRPRAEEACAYVG